MRIHPLAVANICVVIACFAAVARMTDVHAVWKMMAGLSPVALIGAVALHALIIVLLSIRWSTLVGAMGLSLSTARAMALTFTSTLLNLVLPTSVGGDLGRVWLARGDGVDSASGAAAAVFDRAVGLATLVMMVLAAVLIGRGEFAIFSSTATLVVAIACVVVALVLLVQVPRLLRSQVAQKFSGGLTQILAKPRTLVLAAGLSLGSHGLAAVIAAVIAQGMGLDLPLWSALLLFPAVLLAALMPISVGGWGVRELAAIPLLAQAGIGADSATAIAIIFGITQLIAAGLGALVGVARGKRLEVAE